jgi:hypothetical protein
MDAAVRMHPNDDTKAIYSDYDFDSSAQSQVRHL